MISSTFKGCAMLAGLLLVSFALADDGHDHGEAKSAAATPALPRFTAQSELFEAVGILGKSELAVIVDRAASNEPVLNATVELESTGIKLVGKFAAAQGEYHFDARPFAKTGEYPITLTIRAGQDSDLLTGDLEVHATSTAAAATALTRGWKQYALWAGAILIAAALSLWAGLRLFFGNRRNRTGAKA